MAIINFYDDILGEVSETKKAKKGQKLQTIINKYIEEKDSIITPYEVYDIETGETSTFTPEIKEYKTLCLVNGNEQTDLEYKIQKDDIVNFIVIPEDMSTEQWVNYVGGAVLTLGGVALSVFTYGAGATIGAGLIYAGIGMIVGQAASDIIDAVSDKSSSSSKKRETDSMKEAEDTLKLSDGSNQNILNHRYPILLGKHLINPYVAGSAFFTTQTGENGEDKGHYLTKLFIVAGGPLKITDIKIGETMVAYNRSFENTVKNSVMHGMLRGYNDADTGDILKKWKNNDVSIEILQAGTLLQNDENRYGTLYPQTVEQKSPNANILNIKDGDIKDVANRSYMGTAIPNGFKTNSVRFSRSCPQRIEVEFSFPSGLYAYRTRKEDGKIFYYNVPVSFAIQWRYVKKNQKSSDADSPDGWNNFDYIDVYDGQSIQPGYYTKAEKYYEYNSMLGKRAYLDISDQDSVADFFLKDNFLDTKIFNLNGRYTSEDTSVIQEKSVLIKGFIGVRDSHDTVFWSTNEVFIETGLPVSSVMVGDILSGSVASKLVTQPRIRLESKKAYSSGGTYTNKTESGTDSYWSYIKVTEISEMTNILGFQNYIKDNSDATWKHNISKDDINISARSYVAVKEFTPDECAKLINYSSDSDEYLDSVEVRVIRLTPAYFQETTWSDSDSGTSHKIDEDWTAMNYSDLMKWDYLRTFSFDKDKFKESLDDGSISLLLRGDDKTVMRKLPLRPIKEDDLNHYCYIALKLKQDAAETGGKSLNQVSCIIQNLVPNYDSQSESWVPAVINQKTNSYHKYLDSSSDYKIEDISEQEYLDAMRQRETVTLFIDGTDVATNTVKSNNIRYYLSTKGLEYTKLENPGKDYIFNVDGTDYTVDLTNIYSGGEKVITSGLYVSAGNGDSFYGVFIRKTDSAAHSIYVYKKNSSIKTSEYYQSSDGNDFSDQLRKEIFNYSTLSNSSVDAEILYTTRPVVSGSDLIKNGYTDAESNKEYRLFAQKYTNESILNSKYPTYSIVVTPIKPDGTILSKAELDAEADKLLRGQEDTEKILLASFKPMYAIKTGLSLTGKNFYYTDSADSSADGSDDYCLSEQADYYIQIEGKIQEIYSDSEHEYYEKLFTLLYMTPKDIQTEDIEQYATSIGLQYDFTYTNFATLDYYKKKILRILYRTVFIEALKQMGLVTLDESEYAKFYLPEYLENKYCSQNPASQFLYALVGPALGVDSKTYDCVNMDSVTELYKFCEDVTDGTKAKNSNSLLHMKFTCNGIISSEIKFETLLKNILTTGRSSLKRDEKNRYEVLIGRETDYPVGVLNQQNIISKSNSRSFTGEISGYLADFVDETDNYTQNSIYVMNDGEDYRKPTKEISNISVNYVTNREQMYSLVRYSLCTTLYQKESYSYTVGSIGYALSVGDVLLLQDDSLLVGKESGARIATLITSSDENYLYGITVDNPVEFTGEKGFGCTIVQPEKYQASRCVTLEFCDKNGVLIDEDNGIKLTPEIGLTNTLYFKEPIYLGSGKDSESGATVQVVPKIGNLVAFGNLKAITEKVLILGITPKDKGQFELRLVPYKPELYNMGNKMPVFTANMTIPSRAEDEITLSDKTSVYEQEQKVADATASVIEKIDALSKDIDVTPPTAPVLTGISSDDDGNITLVWSGSTDDKSGVSEYCIYHKTDGQFVRLQAIPHEDSLQAQYTFTHITSDKFTTHYYYITAKDKMNNESEQSEILSVTNPVLTTPYEPKALKAFALRDYIRLEWTCEQSVNASLTPRLFKVEIRRGGTEEWESVGEYTQNETLYYFDRTKDGYKEADEVSQYQFRVKSVSVYGLESDYCTLESVSVDNYFGWKIGDIEITSYATEGMLFIKANVKGSAYGDKFLDVKYGDTVVAENSLAGRMFYMKLEGYQEVSDITGKDISVICRSVADEASKTLAGSEIDTSLYKTYKITKPNVTAYADKQGIHISWSDNTGDYYLEPTYKLTIDGNEILSAKDTLEYDWLFEDGAYPTKADILAHTISLSVSTDADSAMISDIAVDVSVFKGWIPDIPEIKLSVSGRTVPLSWNIQSDNVYDFLGCEIQVAKGYKVTDGKYSVITDEGGLEWYAPALGLNPYESLDNYRKGEIDGYLSVKGSSVAFSVPLYGQDNDGAVNTMYVYRARAFTKGGKSDWSDAYFIEVKPVSAYDVVKAWDINDSGEKVKIDGALGANQIFVNELSAICANLGYITDGALQTDAYNYWAVNDTPLSDGTVLPKGSFRVGGENEYMEVTPIIDDNGIATGDYNLTIVAKKFTTTTNVTILNNKLFLVRDSEGNILFKAGVYEKNPDAEDDYGLADGDDKNYIRVNEGYYTSTDLRTILKKELTVTEKNMSTTAKLPFALAQKDIVSVYKNKIFFVLPDSDDAKKSGTYADGDGSDKLYYDIGIYCYENNTVKKIKTLSTALDEITYTLSLFSHYLFRINLKNGVYEIIDLETDETKIISPEQLGNLDDIFDKKYPSSNFIKFEITGNKYFFESYEVLSVTKTVFKYIKSTDTAFVSGKEYYDADGNLMDVTSDTFVKDVYYEKESSDYIQTVFVSLDNPQQMLMVDIDDFPIITNSIVTQTLGDAYTADNEYIYIFVSGSIWSHILRIKRDLSAYDVCILYLSNYIKAKENLLINSTNETTDLSYMYVYGTYKGKKNSSLKVIDGKLSLIGTYSVYDENPDNSLDAKVYTGIFDIENPVWLSGEEINNGSGSAVKVSIYGNKLENLTCCTWYSNSTNEIFQYTCAGINESLFVPVATTDDKILFASKLNKGDPISSLNSSLYILDRAPGEIQESKYYNVCGSISETEIKKDFSSSPCLPNQILNVLFVNDNTIFCMYGNSVSYFTSLSPIYIKIQRLAVDLDFSISMGVGIFNTENKFTVTQKRAYETGIGFSGFYQDKDTENYRYLLASGAYLEFDKDGKLVTDNRGPKGDTGSQGEKGDKGDKGDTGETGTSITKVEQTETSDLPNGTNKLEITMSDGTKTEFSVKNGAIGDADIVLTDDDFNDIME